MRRRRDGSLPSKSLTADLEGGDQHIFSLCASASRASHPVIGMPREDRHGAIELFGEQNADQLMRPGHRGEI